MMRWTYFRVGTVAATGAIAIVVGVLLAAFVAADSPGYEVEVDYDARGLQCDGDAFPLVVRALSGEAGVEVEVEFYGNHNGGTITDPETHASGTHVDGVTDAHGEWHVLVSPSPGTKTWFLMTANTSTGLPLPFAVPCPFPDDDSYALNLHVFNDVDGDGVQSASESDLANSWMGLRLRRCCSIISPIPLHWALTDAAGNVRWNGLWRDEREPDLARWNACVEPGAEDYDVVSGDFIRYWSPGCVDLASFDPGENHVTLGVASGEQRAIWTPTVTLTPSITPTPTQPAPTVTPIPARANMRIDCDVDAAGVQDACVFPASTTRVVVAVVAESIVDNYENVAAFDMRVRAEPQSVLDPELGSDSDLNGNPDFAEDGAGEVGLWTCASHPPVPDQNDDPKVAISYLSCVDGSFYDFPALAPKGQMVLAFISYQASPGTAALSFDRGSADLGNSDGFDLATCNGGGNYAHAFCPGATIRIGVESGPAGGPGGVAGSPTSSPDPTSTRSPSIATATPVSRVAGIGVDPSAPASYEPSRAQAPIQLPNTGAHDVREIRSMARLPALALAVAWLIVAVGLGITFRRQPRDSSG